MAVLALGLAGSLAGGGLFAYFSDVEVSPNHTFQAGKVNVALDADWYDNGAEYSPWPEEIPLIDPFETADIKPGYKEGTRISVHPYSDEEVYIRILNITNGENARIDPELEAGDISDDVGELADYLWLEFWEDNGPDGIVQSGDTGEGDNVPQTGEAPIWSGYASGLGACNLWRLPLPVLPGCHVYYLGFRWEFRIDNGSGIDVNVAQGDTFGCDIQFEAIVPGTPNVPTCP